MKHDYVLYYYPTCPYCRKVFRALEKLGEERFDITKKDATDPATAGELVQIGGKEQVPCLVIDGKAMYESDDIIDYLRAQI